MYMTTKSLRCSISCETMACAASTSSSSERRGFRQLPIYRPAETTSRHNTIHRERIVTFGINNSLITTGESGIV